MCKKRPKWECKKAIITVIPAGFPSFPLEYKVNKKKGKKNG